MIIKFANFSLFLIYLLINVRFVLSFQKLNWNYLNANSFRGNILTFTTFPKQSFMIPAATAGLAAATEPLQVDYQQSQLWKIHTQNLRHDIIKILYKLGAEIWNVNLDGIDMFLRGSITNLAKEIIDKSDLTYNIMIEDIQEVINQNKHPASPLDENNINYLRSGLNMTWDQYPNLDEIDDFLDSMLDKFPKISELMTAGLSVERRHIKVLRISNGRKNNPAIVITGGIQARDWISPAAVTYSIYKLAMNWRENPKFLRDIDWYFVPLLNPDGYEYSHKVDRLWSKNRHPNGGAGGQCQGVNLDRNFSFGWGKKGSSGDPCSRMYRGVEKFSEPETKAFRKLIKSIKSKLAGYITVGGFGQLITYPWGDDDYIPKNAEEMHRVAKLGVKNIRKVTRSEYRVGTAFRLQIASPGNSADWVLNTAKPEYVFNLVLRDQGRYGYLLPPDLIKTSGEEVFEMMQTVAEAI